MHTHTHAYTHMHIQMYTHMHAHTNPHTRTHTHTHTHATQAQSLDIRQAIDTALEAAGPLYRAHYAEWGAVHQHSAQAMQRRAGASGEQQGFRRKCIGLVDIGGYRQPNRLMLGLCCEANAVRG